MSEWVTIRYNYSIVPTSAFPDNVFSLMSALSRIVRATNWKYALGEIALIFIGITLALAANTWYEDRQDQGDEREILQQMIVGLNSDLAALRDRSSATAERLSRMKALQKHIESGTPYSSDLDSSFTAILVGSGPQMNTAAFETLKYRGIDLVSSPQLRSQIVDYYDTERLALERRNQFDGGDSNRAVPLFNRSFAWEPDDLSMSPLDYDSLVKNQEFL